jgi:protein-S-isoprenylcysteine O-methyltransferase Ste14
MLKIIRLTLFVGVAGAALFVPAGRLDVPGFWAYLLVIFLVTAPALALIDDAGLAAERRRPAAAGLDGGLRKFAAPTAAVHFVVAGLDVGRYGWSAPPPVWLQASALIVVGAAFALVWWSMAANTFFSPIVRIQAERGHHVVRGGPYRFVRHPGYLGMAGAFCLSGVALGSWWSILPAMAYVALVLRRTAIEDRFLMEKLDGYADYARVVRYRLLPLVW